MPTDYAPALEEFTRFAEQGDAQAQFHLGQMFGLGLGVDQDYRMAMDWYAQAACQGHPRAQNNLGWMYGTGRGMPQDFIRAYAWYSVAAAHGEDTARVNRDLLAEKMTASQLERAQTLAQELAQRIADNDSVLT